MGAAGKDGVPSSGGVQVVQAIQAGSNWHSYGSEVTSHMVMDL